MKKLLSIVLVLSFALCIAMPSLTVAADGLNITSAAISGNVPENPFSGNGTDFEGTDGSKTTVYDNGSMKTEYADGTKQGIDFNGNLYKEEKDGTQTLTEINGNMHTIYPDGKEIHTSPGGTKTTYYPDGTSANLDETGVLTKHDANGDIVSMGFEGGETIDFIDGFPPEGKNTVKGPNGEKLTIDSKDDEEKGTSHTEIKAEGNGRSWSANINDDGTTLSMDIKHSDGSSMTMEQKDDEFKAHMETSDKKDGFDIYANGRLEDMKMTVTIDGKENNIISSEKNEDGSYRLFVGDKSDDSMKITVFPTEDGDMDNYGFTVEGEDGWLYHRGSDGEEFNDGNGSGFKVDAEGNPVWANVKDENGNTVFSIEDGITKMRFEDPNDLSKYYDAVIDKDGNPISMVDWKGNIVEWKDGAIYKNGELIKEQKIEEIIDADGDGMPEQVNLTDKGTPMPIENIGGSYVNSGESFYYGVNSDWKEVWISAPEGTILDVNITGENTFNIFNNTTGKASPIDLVYDPSTGKAHGEYKPDGIKTPAIYDAAFTDNGDGHISINIVTNWGDTPMLDFHGVK